MGFLSKIFTRWFMPWKNTKLANSLVDFLQALKMAAFVEKGLMDELTEAWRH